MRLPGFDLIKGGKTLKTTEKALQHVAVDVHSAASGVIWASASRLGQQLLQFAVTVVLARMLAPSYFGLVAMVMTITQFLSFFVASGFGAALVQRKQLEHRHLSSAFWMNMAGGLGLTVIVAACSPLIADLYNQPQLVGLTVALSFNFIAVATTIVQMALLQRQLRFRQLAMIQNSASLIGGALGIAAAFAGLGVWSLIIQQLSSSIIQSLGAWFASDWRPRFEIDRSALKDLWGFSANMLGSNVLNYWSRNADNFLVGKFVGAAALGIYQRAYSIMLLPSSQVTTVIGQVMFPALSAMQDNLVRLRRAYLRTISMIALLSFPAAAGLFVMARPFVLTLLGPKWSEVVPVLQILCFPALTQSVSMTAGLIFQARGRTDWMLRWGLVSSAVTLACFAVGIRWGAIGVAASYSIRTAILLYPSFSIPGRLIDSKFTHVVRVTKEALAGSVALVLAVAAFNALLGSHMPVQAELVIDMALALGVYVAVLALIRPPSVDDLLEILRKRIGKRRADRSPIPPAADAA